MTIQSFETKTAETPLPVGMPPAQIFTTEFGISSKLIDIVKDALAKAVHCQGKLDPSVLDIDGMSGKKYRYLINNIVGALQDPRYLEIGSWMGSTLCAAIHRNEVTAVAIDNWSQFGGPIFQFFQNVAHHASHQTKISVLTADFREVNYGCLGKFNVYLFDGPHRYADQYDGLILPMNALDDEFIFIVDDWNWIAVRSGTFDAIKNSGLEISYMTEIRTTSDNTHPDKHGKDSDWHNGYFIAVLRKSKKKAH